MAIRMIEQRRGTATLVSDGSTLYVFRGSIARAQIEGAAALRAQVFPHGAGVSDVPREGASVVWMDNVPYLFPGSLTDASDIGKGYKRQWLYLKRTQRDAERRAVEGFARQYGDGIGEEA